MTLERWRPSWPMRRWGPLRGLEEMERRFEEAFPFFPATWRRLSPEEGWAPAIEMYEKEDRFTVKAELPGMKKEDIDISLEGDTLTIKGERKSESEVREEDYYFSERSYGSFFRSIRVPTSVDADKIQASYENGVLEVSLPKAPELKPKKVEISAK